MTTERIGRYNILEEIASGAQGAVYRAWDTQEDRVVALKVLHASLTGDASYLERFRREATLTASIDHPNVIRVYEVGESEGRHFIAMEFLPESLARVMETSEGLSLRFAASIAAQVANGLAAAHAAGVVHRDIKAQNILIAPDGTPKVTDFGIARGESMATVTATGMLMGTPHYMSPEQARGDRVDARSDVYSLGCVLYQMLAGETPFHATTPISVVHAQIYEDPQPLAERRSGLSEGLVDAVARAMAKDPAARFQAMPEMAAAVRDAVPEARAAAPTSPVEPVVASPLPPGGIQRPTRPPLPAGERLC